MQKFYVGIAKVKYTLCGKRINYLKSDHHCGVFLIEAWEKYKLSLFLETAENRATPQKAVYGFCK